MAEIETPQPRAPRFRLREKEKAFVYIKVVARGMHSLAGSHLTAAARGVISDLSGLPGTAFRNSLKPRLTPEYIISQMRQTQTITIPDSAYEVLMHQDDTGNDVPQLDENGMPRFDTDEDGNRQWGVHLTEDKRLYYDSLAKLQRLLNEHLSSSAAPLAAVHSRSNRMRNERRSAGAARARNIERARARVRKEIAKEKKDEKLQRKVDRQFKRNFSTAAKTTAQSARAMVEMFASFIASRSSSAVGEAAMNASTAVNEPAFAPLPVSESDNTSDEAPSDVEDGPVGGADVGSPDAGDAAEISEDEGTDDEDDAEGGDEEFDMSN